MHFRFVARDTEGNAILHVDLRHENIAPISPTVVRYLGPRARLLVYQGGSSEGNRLRRSYLLCELLLVHCSQMGVALIEQRSFMLELVSRLRGVVQRRDDFRNRRRRH